MNFWLSVSHFFFTNNLLHTAYSTKLYFWATTSSNTFSKIRDSLPKDATMCFLPIVSSSGRRAHARVKAGTHSVFIEKFPRRYPHGHPRWVKKKKEYQPGEPIPAHINPLTGESKDMRKPKMAFVVRRPDAHDDAHERGELGKKMVGQVWTPYKRAFGAEFRGGRFFDPGDIGGSEGEDQAEGL
jgi:hypothetical protein